MIFPLYCPRYVVTREKKIIQAHFKRRKKSNGSSGHELLDQLLKATTIHLNINHFVIFKKSVKNYTSEDLNFVCLCVPSVAEENVLRNKMLLLYTFLILLQNQVRA